MILRVPIGAYGSSGPYHSSSDGRVTGQILGNKIDTQQEPTSKDDDLSRFKSLRDTWTQRPLLEQNKGTRRSQNHWARRGLHYAPLAKDAWCRKLHRTKTAIKYFMCIITYGMGYIRPSCREEVWRENWDCWPENHFSAWWATCVWKVPEAW